MFVMIVMSFAEMSYFENFIHILVLLCKILVNRSVPEKTRNHQMINVSYSCPQPIKLCLHYDFVCRRGAERFVCGNDNWNNYFCDADAETEWESYCFLMLDVILCW